MQAIETKYIGPSNVRGARIKASCDAGSITVSYPYELSGEAVHRYAATELCNKLAAKHGEQWNAPFISGGLPSGNYAHVFLS